MVAVNTSKTTRLSSEPHAIQPAIDIRLERDIDVRTTALLLDRSFANGYSRDSDYLDWLYNHCCGHRAIVAAAYERGNKIGQMVFLPHEIDVDGERRILGLTVDFFVLPQHRNGPLVLKLTRSAIDICRAQGLDGVYGVPNIKSLPIVTRFMKTRPTKKLGLRVGVALPIRRTGVDLSVEVSALDDQTLQTLLEPYVQNARNSRLWTAQSLRERLRSPVSDFAIHRFSDVLAISCRFPIKGVTFTMLCGFWSRTTAPISREVVRALVGAACQLHKHPNFCYIGVNASLTHMPGFDISGYVHSSPLTVVWRGLAPLMAPYVPDRCEMIDFDMV